MFAIADFSRDYYNIELDEASSFLITLDNTCDRSGFTRMAFGLTVAGDAFYQKLDTVFSNLDFYTVIADVMIM